MCGRAFGQAAGKVGRHCGTVAGAIVIDCSGPVQWCGGVLMFCGRRCDRGV